LRRVVAALTFLAAASRVAPAVADHGGAFRVEGMSPLASALLTGGLAFVVALIVVVVVMVMTRPGPDRK
jgi:type IV secretory pathway VirB2 component (pilin)